MYTYSHLDKEGRRQRWLWINLNKKVLDFTIASTLNWSCARAIQMPLDVVLKQTVLSGRKFPTATVLSLDFSGLQQLGLPLGVVWNQTVLCGREFPTAAVLSLDESGLQQPVLPLDVSVLQQAVLFRDVSVCLFTSSLYHPIGDGLQQLLLHL
jgi:hypothetical protein